jgi:hypothetical protein
MVHFHSRRGVGVVGVVRGGGGIRPIVTALAAPYSSPLLPIGLYCTLPIANLSNCIFIRCFFERPLDSYSIKEFEKKFDKSLMSLSSAHSQKMLLYVANHLKCSKL